MKIIYSDDYNFRCWRLEKWHVFPGSKYAQIKDGLTASGKLSPSSFLSPPAVDEGLFRNYLDPDYLVRLRDRVYLARVVELPWLRWLPYRVWQKRLLYPMKLATMGTIWGAKVALQEGSAINLGGGFHHASFWRGGGFCFFPDVPIAVREVQRDGLCQKVAVVDLDVHQGDGTAYALGEDKEVLLIDLFEGDIFPQDDGAQEYVTVPVSLPASTGDQQYLETVQRCVLPALDDFKPELIVLVAGTDVYGPDPLSHLQLTKQGIVSRDGLVLGWARQHGTPWLMVLGGGYHRHSADIVTASILANCL